MPERKEKSYFEKLKEKAELQKNYGGTFEKTEAKIDVKTCPNCGAGKAQQDGLTHCAYCSFEFIKTTITDGIYLKKSHNSQH